MTTAVKAVLHGHPAASVAANPFGIVAVVVAIILVARWNWKRVEIPLVVLVGCAALSWAWELHRFGFV